MHSYCICYLLLRFAHSILFIYERHNPMNSKTTIISPYCLLACLGLFCSASASASTYYVSTTGSDNNPGSDSSPFATIQRGVDAAVADDTVLVQNGIYGPGAGHCTTTSTAPNAEGPSGMAVTITKAGMPNAPIRILAAERGGATLDAQLLCHSYFSVLPTAAYIDIEGFVIMHGYWTGINSAGNNVTYRHNVIKHIGNIVTDTAGGKVGILTHPGTSNSFIDGNVFHDIGRTGGTNNWHDQNLYLEGNHITVVNNIFYKMLGGWAIAAKVGNDYYIANNIFYGPAAGGNRPGQIVIGDDLAADANMENVVIRNNIFANPLTAAVVTCYVSLSGTISFDHNLVAGPGPLDTVNTTAVGCGPSTFLTPLTDTKNIHNISTQNVLFANAAEDDFHTRGLGSPQVGAGATVVQAPTDIDGYPRPPRRLRYRCLSAAEAHDDA
jgi:hypothetical protein